MTRPSAILTAGSLRATWLGFYQAAIDLGGRWCWSHGLWAYCSRCWFCNSLLLHRYTPGVSRRPHPHVPSGQQIYVVWQMSGPGSKLVSQHGGNSGRDTSRVSLIAARMILHNANVGMRRRKCISHLDFSDKVLQTAINCVRCDMCEKNIDTRDWKGSCLMFSPCFYNWIPIRWLLYSSQILSWE